MADWVISNLPRHTTYIEPFGGSAAVLLAKKPSKVEIYNDLYSDVVNFFRVIRDKEKCEEIIRLSSLTPYSREEFNEKRELLYNRMYKDEMEWAYAFFVCANMCFGGNIAKGKPSFGLSFAVNSTNPVNNNINSLVAISERLKEVVLENKDALELIDSVPNNKDFLLYLDPPYHDETGDSSYANKIAHNSLLELILKKDQCNIVISGFNHDSYNILLANGFEICKKNRPIKLGKNNANKRNYKDEILWIRNASGEFLW